MYNLMYNLVCRPAPPCNDNPKCPLSKIPKKTSSNKPLSNLYSPILIAYSKELWKSCSLSKP